MTAPGTVDVRLVRFPVATLRQLVDATFHRPPDWHPEYRTSTIAGIAGMLLTAYEATGTTVEETSPWWVFAVEVDGRLVGDAGFHGPPAPDHPVEVEIGYQVVPSWRGRGVATRACALLLEHAWRHGADVVRADVEPENPDGAASRAVLRANGFTPTPRGDLAVTAPVGRRA